MVAPVACLLCWGPGHWDNMEETKGTKDNQRKLFMPYVNVDFLVNNTVVAGMNIKFTFTYLSKNPVRMNVYIL